MSEFFRSLSNLVDEMRGHPDREVIGAATLIAEENIGMLADIVPFLESKVFQAPPHHKLAIMYLIDSICKRVGGRYVEAFARKIFALYMRSFQVVPAPDRKRLLHLLDTWEIERTFSRELTGSLRQAIARESTPSSKVYREPVRGGYDRPRDHYDRYDHGRAPPPPRGWDARPRSPPRSTSHGWDNRREPVYDDRYGRRRSPPRRDPRRAEAPRHRTSHPMYSHDAGRAAAAPAAPRLPRPSGGGGLLGPPPGAPRGGDPRMARRGSPPRGGRVRPRPEPVKRLTRNKRRRSRSPVADGAGMGAAGAGGGGGGAVGPRRTGKFVDLHAFPADAVSALYHSGPMCSICGLRYTDKAELEEHLSWHFKQQQDTSRNRARWWYREEDEWLHGVSVSATRAVSIFQEADALAAKVESQDSILTDNVVIVDDGGGATCPICGDTLETTYNDDCGEFVYSNAVRVDDAILHATCHQQTAP